MKVTMQATSSRSGTYRQTVRVRDHQLIADEPLDQGGDDTGPCPQEMYAQRKGWDIGDVEVACEYAPADRGCPTKFSLVMRMPDSLSAEQVERLRVIAAKCPVHRTLDGEVMFDERVERLSLAH